jgi:hypothetical protein
MRQIIRAVELFAAALMVSALLPAVAGAHESRDVADGQYRLVVGFLNEPVAVGDKSGLDLRVTKPVGESTTPIPEGEDAFAPVEGLETTLQAEVYYGDQTLALTLEARFGQPGAYASWFYPNAAGTYSFRIFGAIEGVAIDETFTSGPDTFGDVEERLLFPADAAAAAPAVTGAGTADLPGGTLGGVAIAAIVAGSALWFGVRERLGRRASANRSA